MQGRSNVSLSHDSDNENEATRGDDPSRYRLWFENSAVYNPRKVVPLKHSLSDHPLMQLPRLEQLAHSLLSTGQCKFIAPDTAQNSPFNTLTKDPTGKGIADVFAQIETPGAWIALYSVQSDPEYRKFLWEAVETLRPQLDAVDPGIFRVDGFIFISAPPSVTPFHIDRENNFWLQLRGRKTINVWDPADRQVISEKAIEAFIVQGDLSEVQLREGLEARSFECDMGPGDGVYMPSTSAHMTRTTRDWVKPGEGVSVSMGLVFYTASTRRAANIRVLNLFLRQRGLNPTPPGESGWRDAIKYPLAWFFVRARRLLRGYQLRQGM